MRDRLRAKSRRCGGLSHARDPGCRARRSVAATGCSALRAQGRAAAPTVGAAANLITRLRQACRTRLRRPAVLRPLRLRLRLRLPPLPAPPPPSRCDSKRTRRKPTFTTTEESFWQMQEILIVRSAITQKQLNTIQHILLPSITEEQPMRARESTVQQYPTTPKHWRSLQTTQQHSPIAEFHLKLWGT